VNIKTFSALRASAAPLALVVAGFAGSAAFVAPAMAQDYTRGNLVGDVVDQAGAPVAGAEVTIRSNEQGFTRTTTTDAGGQFRATALPTGTYSVTVTVGGAVVVQDNSASVNAGSNNSYRYSTGEAAADTGGAIVVTGTRVRTNDFAQNTSGLTLNVQQIAESVPIARSQSALILLAPGTNAGDTGFGDCPDCVSFGGASIAENSYYVNGLNTTNFRTFVGNNVVPFEFYRTFDVKTGGWSAEYGRALGGVTSAVTKSGSNNFEYGAVIAYTPNFLTEDSPNTFQDPTGKLKSLNQRDYRESIEANFYASGPLIKDRLFFYGLVTPRYRETEDTSPSTGYRVRSHSNSPFYGAKLDFIPFDGHRIEGTFWSDERTINYDYYNIDSNANDRAGIVTKNVNEGREINKIGGKNWIVQYTGQFTDFFTLSGAYGENRYRRTDIIGGGALAGPIVQTQLAYNAAGAKTTALSTIAGVPVAPTDGSDLRKVMRLDADLYVNLLGSHHFRFGFDREDLSVSEDTFYTGDRIYRFTANYIRSRTYINQGFFKTKQTAFYAQDSWDLLNDRVNLQLGVRNDRFENFSITGAKYVDLKNQWAPRLGASFDVFGDKLTKIQAFWGRYYLPVATNTNIRLGGAETFYEQRFRYATGVVGSNYDQSGIPIGQQFTASGAPVLGTLTTANALNCPNFGPGAGQKCTAIFSDGVAGATDTLVSQNLKPMYQDEFIVGLTHRMDDWTFGIRYINRRLKQTLEDVAIDAAVNKYCASKGLDCTTSSGSPIWSGFHQYVLANPGEPITVRLDGDPAIKGTTDVITLSAADLNYPKPVRRYDSIEFTASKAFNGTFGFDFSYTYQKLRGNYEGSVKSDNNQDDAGLTQDYDQPGLSDGSYGTLANNREHTFKLFGSWQPIDWLRIGANLTVQSPRNFSCIGVHPTDAFAAQYGAASFFCANPLGNGGSNTSKLVPRGTAFKSDWLKNLDMGFQFKLGESLGDSNFRVDVFNVFNWKSKTDFVEFGETDSGAIRADYRLPTGYQAPRQVRFTWTMRFGGKNGE
jgi:hypothetical protein